jgi:hypothetical protein
MVRGGFSYCAFVPLLCSIVFMNNVPSDAKESASLTFADLVRKTADYFPEPKFRADTHPGRGGTKDGEFVRFANDYVDVNPRWYNVFANSDGTGTKPELAERLFAEDGDYRHFEDPAFDVVAMVADDASRDGHFVLGIVNCLDM